MLGRALRPISFAPVESNALCLKTANARKGIKTNGEVRELAETIKSLKTANARKGIKTVSDHGKCDNYESLNERKGSLQIFADNFLL